MNAFQKEAEAARETVLVVAAEERSAIVATGSERTSWLNGLLTCELAKLGPSRAAYGLLVEKKGRIQSDMFVVPSTDALALAVPKERRDEIVATLDHYLVMEDVELAVADLHFYVAHGPASKELLSLATYAGTVDLLGKGGAVLGVAAQDRADFEARLKTELARLGGIVGSDAAWNAVRIEHGLPRFGTEVDTTLYPQEASLEKLAVAFDKGCYLGQEVVYMLENRGHVKRKLVAIDLEGTDVPAVGAEVKTPAGDTVGDVKSATLGPIRGTPVAIAMIKWAQAKPGTELAVEQRLARVR